MTETRVHIFISGRVQGVNFRYYTQQQAQSRGLKGWVRNLPD
ncbi:MAG: acylphosphatase, partial [Armatimonadetes bacterium]|nr:acylphosphatase [Armatimonadota bacterium]NIM66602.1 acylphosphatase [Armatimonadota bacterium]